MSNLQVGTVNGDKNKFKQNNIRINNIYNNHRDSKEISGDEAMGFAVAAFFAVVVAVFLYLKHYESIFFWLKYGVVIAGLLHIASIIPGWRDSNSSFDAMKHSVAGMFLSIAQLYVIVTAFNALPYEVLEVASHPRTANGIFSEAMEVWNRFNSFGHRLIIENMIAALLLMPAIVLNALYGVQHLFNTLAESELNEYCEVIANQLRIFKLGALIAAFFTLGAGLIVTGCLYTLLA